MVSWVTFSRGCFLSWPGLGLATALDVDAGFLLGEVDEMTDEDRELWELREQVRRDPDRHYLFSLAKDANIDDVRQAVAIIDALKKTRGGD